MGTNTSFHKSTPPQPIWCQENLVASDDMKPLNKCFQKYYIKQWCVFCKKNNHNQNFRQQSSQSKNNFRILDEKEYYNEVEKLIRKNKKVF
jgi:hypothetical protein